MPSMSGQMEMEVEGVQRVAEFYRVCVVVLLVFVVVVVVVVVCIRIYQKYFMHISCAFMNLKLSFLANKLDAQLSYRASPLLYSTPLHWLLSTSLLSFCAARLSLLSLLLLLILSQASKSSCKWQEFVAVAVDVCLCLTPSPPVSSHHTPFTLFSHLPSPAFSPVVC